MQETILTIRENTALTGNVFRMTLTGNGLECQKPGQFVNIGIEGLFLRRPVSVYVAGQDYISIIYKTVGKGTARMSEMKPGEKLNVLTGLGNGYDLGKAGDHPLLIGGGVGVPPLYYLARKLREEGIRPTVILGFNTAEEVFCEDAFRSLGCDVTVTTVDGSYGAKGFATDVLPESYSFFYTCGPMPMLRSVFRRAQTDGQFSLEERMGCGFGACMGCSIQTRNGSRRVCKDGPVFDREVLLWED